MNGLNISKSIKEKVLPKLKKALHSFAFVEEDGTGFQRSKTKEELIKYRNELYEERREIAEEISDLERPMYLSLIDNQQEIDDLNAELEEKNIILKEVVEKINQF